MSRLLKTRSDWLEIKCLVSARRSKCVLGAWLIIVEIGMYEFVKKGDPPVMGITKLGNGVTEEFLKRPRKVLASPTVEGDAVTIPESFPTANPPTTPQS
jgi:hypothetical protein